LKKTLDTFLSEKSEPEFPLKIDLLRLYGRFIEGKYFIFYREKSRTEPFNMAKKEHKERENKTLFSL
jgi:hypothetical protein